MARSMYLFCFLALLSFVSAQQPPAPPARGTITGTVVDGSTGEAVAGAIVYLSSSEPARPVQYGQTRQVTDGRGRFAFVELAGDASYTIAASKFGYLDGGYGRDVTPVDPLRSIQLKPDEWVSNLRVQIWRPGAISGTVRDESGEPVVGVFVRALARHRIQGRDDLVAGPLTLSNDRGEYRLTDLSPGRYLVQVPSVQAAVPAQTKMAASQTRNAPQGVVEVDESHRLVIGRYPVPPPPANGRQMAYGAIFHPAATSLSQAMAIDLKFGEERPAIDLTLVPVPTARITGLAEGPAEALRSLTLRLLPAGLENLGFGSEVATTLVDADGRFTFINVPAGSYIIDAPVRVRELTSVPTRFTGLDLRFPSPPPAQGSGFNSSGIDLIPGLEFVDSSFRSNAAEYSGRAPVMVAAADVPNVVVRLRPHATMSGRIVVQASASKPTEKAPARFPMRLDPATGESALGMPQNSFQDEGGPNTFAISGIQAGSYWLRLSAYPTWTARSILWKGRDYGNAPFDIAPGDDLSDVVMTVTNDLPELTGTVRGTTEVSADSALVVAFPLDPAQWRNTGFNPARLKHVTVSSERTYRFAILPAGDYYVAAIDRARRATWRDPEFLTRLAQSATRVSLSWGTPASQDLTVLGIR
jgi:hypothetical protein